MYSLFLLEKKYLFFAGADGKSENMIRKHLIVYCGYSVTLKSAVSIKILHKYKAGRDMAKCFSQSSLLLLLIAVFPNLNTWLLNLLKMEDWN